MAKLGFCGLGIMGYPMARNLRQAGHDLRVWSNTRSKAEKLASECGAVPCAQPRDVAENAEAVFLCVGDTSMSRDVILGPGGLAVAAPPVIVDISTISASASELLARQLKASGIEYVDAPCTGSKLGAEGRKLTFMVGAEPEVLDRVRPWLEVMGTQIFHCGPQGSGLRVKLTQNLIQANVLQAFVEGIVLSTKAGIDPRLMLDVLNNTAARSGLVAFKAPYIFRRDFSTHFSVKWMEKDIRLALELAGEENIPVPITAVTHQMFRAAIAQGVGDEDFSSLIKVIERITGVEVRASEESS